MIVKKLPDFCEGCSKKHIIEGDGETCLTYFEPPHIYVTNEECPMNPKIKEVKKVKVNPLKAAKRAKKGNV